MNYDQIMPLKENKQPHPNSLKRNIIRDYPLEEEEHHLLSEARSWMNKHELRVESANMALSESNLQIHAQRVELHQANQSYDRSRREKDWLRTELKLVFALFRKRKS